MLKLKRFKLCQQSALTSNKEIKQRLVFAATLSLIVLVSSISYAFAQQVNISPKLEIIYPKELAIVHSKSLIIKGKLVEGSFNKIKAVECYLDGNKSNCDTNLKNNLVSSKGTISLRLATYNPISIGDHVFWVTVKDKWGIHTTIVTFSIAKWSLPSRITLWVW